MLKPLWVLKGSNLQYITSFDVNWASRPPHHCRRNAFPSPLLLHFPTRPSHPPLLPSSASLAAPSLPLPMQQSIMPILGGERRRRRETHPLWPGWEKGEMKDERHQGATPTRSPSAGRWIPSPSPPWWNPGWSLRNASCSLVACSFIYTTGISAIEPQRQRVLLLPPRSRDGFTLQIRLTNLTDQMGRVSFFCSILFYISC